MNDFESQQEKGLDLWLDYRNHALVIDIIGTLEVESGLREVMISARHADLVADLGCSLDVEAGLAVIVPVAAGVPPSNELLAPNPQSAATADAGQVNPEEAESDAILLEFRQAAASWSPSTRLATRAHPIFNLTGFHDRTENLFLNLRSVDELASELASELDRAQRRLLDRALNLDHALERALDLHLDRNLEPARELAHDLDRNLDLARNIARDLTRDLTCEVARFPDLDRRPAQALNHALDHALDRAVRLDHALDQSLEHPSHARIGARFLALSLDCVHALARGLDRVCSLAGELARTTQALVQFYDELSDVTSVDLRSADLAGIPLEGLRWSAKTRWPPEIEAQISRDSVQIAKGIFEVVRGGTTYAPEKVQHF